METISGRLRLFEDDEDCPDLWSESDSELGAAESDYESDGSDVEETCHIDNEELWSDIDAMINVNAEVVPPSRRLSRKSKDSYTVPVIPVAVAPPRRQSDVLGEFMGLRGLEIRRLMRMHIPACFWNILMVITRTCHCDRDFDCLEMFSGRATIVRAFRKNHMKAAGYDITYDAKNNDLNADCGFITALVLVLRLKSKSVLWWATVCSSWVWMSRSGSQRSKRRVSGNKRARSVATANAQVARMILLSCLGLSRGVSWGLEQPASSLMASSSWVQFLQKLPADLVGGAFTEIHTEMGAFHAETRKPSRLYSIGRWTASLSRSTSRRFMKKVSPTTITYTKSGKKQVTGSAQLKGTQAYTDQFGEAVFSAWKRDGLRSHEMLLDDDDAPSDYDIDFDETAWEDAQLDDVIGRLNVPRHVLAFSLQ